MSQLIKIIYSLNDIDSSVSFDPTLKLSSFKNLLNISQKINLDEYDLFYHNKLVLWTDERSIKELVGKEKVPVFFIKKKVSASPAKNKVIKQPTEKPRENIDFKSKLIIDFFPSRVEILELLDKFYDESGLEKDYQVSHSEGSVEVKFRNAVMTDLKKDHAFEFTKKINAEKLNNPLYFKIKTKLDFDVSKKLSANFKSKSPSKKKMNQKEVCKNLNQAAEIREILNTVQPKKNKTIETDEAQPHTSRPLNSKNSSSNLKIMRLIKHLKDIQDEKVKQKILKLYYSNSV